MPMIDTKTHLELVPLTGDVNETIKNICDAQGVAGRRLAASFESHENVVLIFQKAPA